jgi:hypothetical protein
MFGIINFVVWRGNTFYAAYTYACGSGYDPLV